LTRIGYGYLQKSLRTGRGWLGARLKGQVAKHGEAAITADCEHVCNQYAIAGRKKTPTFLKRPAPESQEINRRAAYLFGCGV